MRFNKTEGNFALNKNVSKEIKEKLSNEGIKVGDEVIKVKVTSGDELKKFWD